jgi:hypothetical protein
VAAPFTKSEHVRVLPVRHINDIVYSKNIRKEEDLKMAFKRHCPQFHKQDFDVQ